MFRLLLIIITFGLLAGCSNPDPLAVASGSVFALNAGHWQPTPQDLSSPPKIVDR
ncbi:MAG: type IV secretion system protein VirB7 [Betaproteobacteria bacterium]|nr:type IV secretion system protein VirB7 [Betaproteobacteria bacterium]